MIKFILRTSDFADFLKNSFRGPQISWTFVKIHSADLGFCGLLSNSFHGPLISRTFLRSTGSTRQIRLAVSFLGFCGDQNFLIVLVMTSL